MDYSAGASPEPSHPPYSVRTLHFVEISQDGNSLWGKLNPQGDSVPPERPVDARGNGRGGKEILLHNADPLRFEFPQ